MEDHRELEQALLKGAEPAERLSFETFVKEQVALELRQLRARDDDAPEESAVDA